MEQALPQQVMKKWFHLFDRKRSSILLGVLGRRVTDWSDVNGVTHVRALK